MKKKITKRGYRVLAIVWTLAAASMGVAFVRRLAEFNLFLLLMFLLSLLTAANFWSCWRKADQAGDAPALDGGAPKFHDHNKLFGGPPKFSGSPQLFDDDPPPPCGVELFADDDLTLTENPNKDSEEKDHE